MTVPTAVLEWKDKTKLLSSATIKGLGEISVVLYEGADIFDWCVDAPCLGIEAEPLKVKTMKEAKQKAVRTLYLILLQKTDILRKHVELT